MWSATALLSGVAVTLAGVTVGAAAVLPDDEPSPAALHLERATPLRELAAPHDLRIGASVQHTALAVDEDYRRVLLHDFDTITLENELKWAEVHPRPGVFALDRAEEVVDFATANGLRVRGHTLVWHQQNPPWLERARLGRDQAIELLRTHIETVVGSFRGRVAEWDVVNEPIDPSGRGLRDTLWRQMIGDDYLSIAFGLAHEADPEARLFLNDYDATSDGAVFDALIDLADELRRGGVPVHGVGFQLHLDGPVDVDRLARQVARAGRSGLTVAFTEVDDRLADGAGAAAALRQARRIAGVAGVCVAEPACRAFVLWGLGDAYSWVPNAFPGYGAATLFDHQLEPKPAYHVLAEVLRTSGDGAASPVRSGGGR